MASNMKADGFKRCHGLLDLASKIQFLQFLPAATMITFYFYYFFISSKIMDLPLLVMYKWTTLLVDIRCP